MSAHTTASVLAELPQYSDAQRALNCLYIAVEESIAKDVGTKMHAAFFALASALADARNALESHVRALDEAMTSACIGVFNAGDDPKKAINDLGMWSQGVGGYFAQEELSRLRPIVEERDLMLKYAREAFVVWEAGDNDMRVGKYLKALSGARGLRPDLDAVRTADATHCPRCGKPTQRDDAHTCAVQRGARE